MVSNALARAAACLVVLAAVLCCAQSSPTSEISGVLTDQTGAVITGATVLVRAEASGQTWSAITGSDGSYRLAGLPPGRYEVHVQQNGFAERVASVTAAGNRVHLPLALSVAALVQQVNVSSSPAETGMDAQQIRERAGRDLGEAVETIPGVDKVRQGAIASDIAIRGLFHENLALTIDGARLYGACPGQMDPAAYHDDLAEVDHVDIVKGPFDVTTQGALGGFVKVVNKQPGANGFAADTNVLTGSYGYYNPSLTLEAGDAAHSLLAGYSYRTSEMYRDGKGANVARLASYRNGDENLQAFRTQSGWLKLAAKPAAGQQVSLQYARQQGGEVLYPYKTMDGIFDNADRGALRYDVFQPHGMLRSLHALLYLDKVNHLMDDRLRASAGMLPSSMSTQVVSSTTGGRLDADLRGNLSFGVESYRRFWNSNGAMTMQSGMGAMTMATHSLPGVSAWVAGAYGTYRKQWGERLLVSGGGRYDYAIGDAGSANSKLYLAYHEAAKTHVVDSGLSGNVRLNWQASRAISVFSGIGSNIRFPDPEERFFVSDSATSNGWVGNPLLRHPRNTETNLGVSVSRPRYSINPLIFFSKLDNDVTLYQAVRESAEPGVQSTSAQSYANVQAHQWGGELTAHARLASWLEANVSVSSTRGTKVPQPARNMMSSNLFQTPPLRAQLALRYEGRRMYAEASTVVTGRQDHVDTDEHELTTAGFSVFHLKAGYRTGPFQLEAGVNNLLAREYSEYLSYARNPYTNGIRLPEPGRNVFVNLKWNWKAGEVR